MPRGDDVDDDKPDAPLQVGSTLRSKGPPRFIAIFVPRTDQLDGGNQRGTGHAAIDMHLDIVFPGQTAGASALMIQTVVRSSVEGVRNGPGLRTVRADEPG
jgi:hypothetical protein